MMGQLSLTDHLVTLAQEFVDTADIAGEDRQRLNSTLDVVSKVIGVSERTSAILGAHLDLTVREAELRMLDLTLVDEADMRARPLFEGHTFGLLSKSDVQAMGQSHRDEFLVKAVASKATSGPKQSKAKAKTAKSTALPNVPSTLQPFRAPPPPQGQGGRGAGARPKTKKFSKR